MATFARHLLFVVAPCLQIAAPAANPNADCAELHDATLSQLFGQCVDNSWLRQLEPDPQQHRHSPNKVAREVQSGHYVVVRPTPLPKPYLVGCSREMLLELGLTEKACEAKAFRRVFSGDVDAIEGFGPTWATPYALSIYGSEQEPGRGASTNGYGDGRAISVAEVLVKSQRWELQLKGSGTTPFCRGADGRAVLRSSVREFLASEAMYHLGVPTTRALSLVASKTEKTARPWYSAGEHGEKHGGDVMQHEVCAMTTRIAPSFIRVGHFELFGRRARQGSEEGRLQLELLARHTLYREYSHLVDPAQTFQEQLLSMAAEVGGRFANLSAEWIRVGYTQSNFNADNCLVSGRTVDYGPFGFVEKYEPSWGMWIHSGEHFSFMNQPTAAGQNFRMFAQSLRQLLEDKAAGERLRDIVRNFELQASEALARMWGRKLGLQSAPAARDLWKRLDKLMQAAEVDYTIFWRQLLEVVRTIQTEEPPTLEESNSLLDLLVPAFYQPLDDASKRSKWSSWLQAWLSALQSEGRPQAEVLEGMRTASPKYIPREWMLVEAYTAAQDGNHTLMEILQDLFRRPYDEQPEMSERFYRKRPTGSESIGGVGFMS